VEHIISACLILAKEKYIKRYDRVCAQLHFNICKEIGVKLDNKYSYDMYQNQSKQVMNIRLPYHGTNKCKPTELFPTINWTSQSMTINKEHAC
jgi:hypothetical protein